jgi:trimethylamine--corrinoid protein Co-methyltransferase
MAGPQFLKVLSDSEVEAIRDTAYYVLERSGVDFLYPEAQEIFKKAGFRVEEDGRVHFTRDQVDAALKSVPKSFTFAARNPERTVEVGTGRAVFGAGYGAPFVTDLEKGRRRGSLEDFRNLTKLVQALPEVEANSAIICEPQDLPEETRHLDMFYETIRLSDKPLMGSPQGKARAEDNLNMAKILFGSDGFDRQGHVMALINVISPLRYDERMLGALIAYARDAQPVIVAPFAMGGASAPMTLAGILAQEHAEILAGITLTQLVRPGAPVLYGTASSLLDMRTANVTIGAAETFLIEVAHTQMAKVYGIPSRAGGSLTDAKLPDTQAGYESMMVMLATALSGTDFVLHGAGILESYLTMSYEKLVVDDEILGLVRRILRGFEVNPETLAGDLICEIGPGHHFLDTDHTLEHYLTEARQPALSDRWGYPEWSNQGSLSLEQRATEKWKKLLAEFEPPALDAKVDEELQKYVAEAKKRIEAELAERA